MELTKDIPGEKLPRESGEGTIVETFSSENVEISESLHSLTDEELTEKVVALLQNKIEKGEKQAIFKLGQLYFEKGEYEEAISYFERVKDSDLQALYQLAVCKFDGLGGCKNDYENGLKMMLKVATNSSKRYRALRHAAQYNVGRAYFQGYGCRQSDDEAIKWWLLAADDGNPRASIKAQTILAMFYSRPDNRDVKKAFFWHSEACGNGSLESQGALGVMYLMGLGTKVDPGSAFVCLREATERGNVYAMGNLISYYFKRKLYTKTTDLAARVSQLEDVDQIAEETECLPAYVAKGLSMACFYYGRCLDLGKGVKQDKAEAQGYYSKAYRFDPDMCARLQNITTHGEI